MTEQPRTRFPQFYVTAPTPCPYLPARAERKVFTHLIGRDARFLNNALTHAGFRRSQNIAYKPACEGCSACISVRVEVDEFVDRKSFRRVVQRNRDLLGQRVAPIATDEQFKLLRDYLDTRHREGGMADMSDLDYASMVEDSSVDTHLVEYRLANPLGSGSEGQNEDADLLAVCLTDELEDGLSLVYSYFDPEASERSLGTYVVLDHIQRARRAGLPYVYLGYWVQASPKMAYKARFGPLEGLGENGWEPLEGLKSKD